MPKVIIELTKDNKTVVTYDNDSIVYPICDVDENNFHISEVTDNAILTLIANLFHQCGTSLKHQLIKQGFVNSALNKPAEKK